MPELCPLCGSEIDPADAAYPERIVAVVPACCTLDDELSVIITVSEGWPSVPVVFYYHWSCLEPAVAPQFDMTELTGEPDADDGEGLP